MPFAGNVILVTGQPRRSSLGDNLIVRRVERIGVATISQPHADALLDTMRLAELPHGVNRREQRMIQRRTSEVHIRVMERVVQF